MKQLRLRLNRRSDWKGQRHALRVRVSVETWRRVTEAAKKSKQTVTDFVLNKVIEGLD